MTALFSEPTEQDLQFLADEWTALKALAEEEYDASIDESMATLDLLQRMLDDESVNREGLISIGTAFGRILLHNIEGLDWCAVTDDAGRTLCLRYEETSLRVNPLTMIARRVNSNEPVKLAELFTIILGEIERPGKVL